MQELKLKNLVLRRMVESDFDFFTILTQDVDITKYFINFIDSNFFDEMIIGQQSEENLFLVVCNENRLPIGILNALYTANNQWLIEYAILSSYRRKGYIYAVLSFICQNSLTFLTAFQTNKSDISSLLFDVKDDNFASQGVLKKLAHNLNLELEIQKDFYEIVF